jgi:hypothetical protein
VVRHRTRRPATDLLVNRPLAASQAGELRNRETTPSEYATQVAAAVLSRQQPVTATTVGGLRDSEQAGERLDPILTPADIRAQVERDIGVGRIEVLPERLRALRPEKAEKLTESIRERGLLHATVVRPRSDAAEGFLLVTGRRRFEAIKLPTIRCKVAFGKELPGTPGPAS